MVLHTDFNQGIKITTSGAILTIQASVEKGTMRYWVGKPDEVQVEIVQCRTSSKTPQAVCRNKPSRPPSLT